MPAERMYIDIAITDEAGNVFTGSADLIKAADLAGQSSKVKSKAAPARSKLRSRAPKEVDLALPLRNFIKTHVKGMGGPQRFTLLLAKLSNGKAHEPIGLKEIANQWGKMKSLLGRFNSAYPTRAKEQGLVDSPKTGNYVLLPGWKSIFRS